MALSPRDEIPNGHIPLAFLLGRRASEYSLPSLNHPPTRKPPHAGSVVSDGSHLRQREKQARALLERVLAREVRLDTKNKEDHDTALAPPQMRVSSADRRRRAAELQRVLDEGGDECDCSSMSRKEIDPSQYNDGSTEDLYHRRDQFAQYHGYVPSEPDFVEIVGHHERIQRTQNLRQLHDDEKRKRVKQLKAKQSRVETLRKQLQQQQVETKHKLKQAEYKLRGPAPEEGSEEEEEEDQPANERAEPTARDRGEHKTTRHKDASKTRDRQQKDEDKARLVHKNELKERHESVQRSRQERQSLRQQRRAAHEHDKSLMKKMVGPGPSFQSTLRMEDPETTSQSDPHSRSCPLLPLEQLSPSTNEEDGEEIHRNEPAVRLQERQLDVFVRSRTRSLQFGGGFGSKPRSQFVVSTNRPSARDECDGITTHATSVGIVKSKREIVTDWKTTLSALGHHR